MLKVTLSILSTSNISIQNSNENGLLLRIYCSSWKHQKLLFPWNIIPNRGKIKMCTFGYKTNYCFFLKIMFSQGVVPNYYFFFVHDYLVRVIKSRRLRWAGHVARMEEGIVNTWSWHTLCLYYQEYAICLLSLCFFLYQRENKKKKGMTKGDGMVSPALEDTQRN